MANSFENLRNKPRTQEAVTETAPSAAAPAAKHKTTSKPLIVADDVTLPTNQQFSFPSWSNLLINFINRRDSRSGWDLIRNVSNMLNRVGYPVPALPAKFPRGKDKSEFEDAFSKIAVAAFAFENDLKNAMLAEKQKADKGGKEIHNYSNQERYGTAINHFLTEAIREVSKELDLEQSGAGGTTFKFDPNIASNLFPVPGDKVPQFLSRVALLLKDDNSVIMEINPQTRDITLRHNKRMTDGFNAIYKAVQGNPEILRLYQEWNPVRVSGG